MSDEKAIYWLSQVIGWFGYILLILFQNLIVGTVDVGIIKVLVANFLLGVGLSHAMRFVIIQFDLLKMKLYRLLPRIIFLSIFTGIAAALIYGLISDLFFLEVDPILVMPFSILIELIIPFITIFLFWNILYFAANYLKNYEREEVKNLRLTASMNEVELSNLRSQMNPHFIFNALNSIRALVDENPVQAKKSITQMSNILRNSLSSGRKKFVTLEDEMRVVNDYLQLEKIRFEERLDFAFHVPEDLFRSQIPPLLIQTLVENAVKHGISHLPQGGKIQVSAEVEDSTQLKISVCNTGSFRPENAEGTGIGLENSRRRLNLLYGTKADLTIYEKEEYVFCDVKIPLEK